MITHTEKRTVAVRDVEEGKRFIHNDQNYIRTAGRGAAVNLDEYRLCEFVDDHTEVTIEVEVESTEFTQLLIGAFFQFPSEFADNYRIYVKTSRYDYFGFEEEVTMRAQEHLVVVPIDSPEFLSK